MTVRDQSGFTLTELLVTTMLITIVLGTAFGAFRSMSDAADGAALSADVNVSLRSVVNLMTRDLLSAGRGMPVGGVSIPSGDNAVALVRPAPGGNPLSFDEGMTTLPSVTPGSGLGPVVAGVSTDLVTLLMADTTIPLDSAPLVAVAADGASVEVDESIAIDDPATAIAPGDLIMLTNALGSTLQMVTSRNGQVIEFAEGDPMNLNQREASQGTIGQLQSEPGTYPPTTATRVVMISYYIDASDPARPLFIRRVNLRPGRTIAVAIANLQVTYDLVDGVTNPVNLPAPVLPNTPHQIRKANLAIAARSYREWSATGQHLHSSLSTQVSLRSMSFVDRYQ
jgi:prepilin-type N-terminal cleavage/methylation domain-containing protein